MEKKYYTEGEQRTNKMLTKKQKIFIDVLSEMVRSDGGFPTLREIALRMKLSSVAAVHAYLTRLYEKGYLQKNGI